MTKLYRVVNKKHVGIFIAATNEQDALELAMSANHARKIENLKVSDVTEYWLNHIHGESLKSCLERNCRGIGTIRITSQGFPFAHSSPIPLAIGSWEIRLNKEIQ